MSTMIKKIINFTLKLVQKHVFGQNYMHRYTTQHKYKHGPNTRPNIHNNSYYTHKRCKGNQAGESDIKLQKNIKHAHTFKTQSIVPKIAERLHMCICFDKIYILCYVINLFRLQTAFLHSLWENPISTKTPPNLTFDVDHI